MDDLEQIRQLKYRYLRTLDTKQWDDFEDCFLPEATADYAGLAFPDRAALVDYMRSNLGPAIVTMHHVHHPEITVDGDTATGRWYLHDQVISAEYRFKLEGAAFYEDRYVRTPEGWKVVAHGLRADLRGDVLPRRPAGLQAEDADRPVTGHGR